MDVIVFCLRPSFLKKRAFVVVVPGLPGDVGEFGSANDDDEPAAPCPPRRPLPKSSPLEENSCIVAEVGDMIIAVFAGMDSCWGVDGTEGGSDGEVERPAREIPPPPRNLRTPFMRP